MHRQLTLNLPVRAALAMEDFFISPSNSTSVEQILNWQDWPGGKLVLIGPHGSGKTHLLHVWAHETGGQIIRANDLTPDDIPKIVSGSKYLAVEDIDQITGKQQAEQALFHLHNLVLAEGGRLLCSSSTPPAEWTFGLKDLSSRLLASTTATMTIPDDGLMAAILVKQFADRQLDVEPEVIRYLVERMERSFSTAYIAVNMLDELALSEARAVTRPLAKRVLNQLTMDDP